MIWAFILRYNRAFIAAALLLALYGAYQWHVASEVEQARLEGAAEAARMDAVADDVAGQIAASEAADVERLNNEARKDAASGNDALKSGLDRLRAGKTSDR